MPKNVSGFVNYVFIFADDFLLLDSGQQASEGSICISKSKSKSNNGKRRQNDDWDDNGRK